MNRYRKQSLSNATPEPIFLNEKTQQRLYDIALRLLAFREHSRFELQRKLILKCQEASRIEIEAVLERLISENALSDQRFTELYIRARQQRGFGILRISKELSERGIPTELFEQLMADIDWLPLAETVRAKRFGKTLPLDFTERMRQMRFLQNKGFSHEDIQFLFRK